ncbi:MAG: T9SS type A sorting domain-containing protein, partial [Bacteroidota bacterium]
FNPSTLIEYALPRDAFVRLEVFGVLGQQITTLVQEERSAGYHAVRFNAGGLPSGVYYYRIVAGDFVLVKRMLLVK